jgi:hypothetical protein
VTAPTETAAQIRFALSELSSRNAHHEFEDLCRHIVRQRICSNVLPATGPVARGGDQGRDFETFRSYLADELGPHGAFLALVRDGPVAFACTTQKSDLKAKIRSDVKKIAESGTTVEQVYFLCTEAIPIAERHDVIDWAATKHDLALEVIDGHAIAELLSDPDTFWIATRFLNVSDHLAPDDGHEGGQLADWYVDTLTRWRQRDAPRPVLGDLLDISQGLRYSMADTEARSNLPFWIDRMRPLADASVPALVRQRARYEIAVTTLRGLGHLGSAELEVRAFMDEAGGSQSVSELTDASVLLLYVTGAKLHGVTDLDVPTIVAWRDALMDHVALLARDAGADADRAGLLDVFASICAGPDLTKFDLPLQLLPDVDPAALMRDTDWLQVAEQQSAGGPHAIPPDPYGLLVDVDGAMTAWADVVDHLVDVPFFPIDNLSRRFEVLAPLLATHSMWRQIVDQVDEAVARSTGQAEAGNRCLGRALRLRQAGQLLQALHELHQAKVEWNASEAIRQAVQVRLAIAEVYLALRLPLAAKYYALSASEVAMGSGRDEVIDLIPHGWLLAGRTDYLRGAWCGAIELYELAIRGHEALSAEEDDALIDEVLVHWGIALSASRALAPELTDTLSAPLVELGFDDVVGVAKESGHSPDHWAEMAREQLLGSPFEDAGKRQTIRFAALGTSWELRSSTEYADARAAERFSAAAQIVLAELASVDLCLMPSDIHVEIQIRGDGDTGTPIYKARHSNSNRGWEITMSRPTSTHEPSQWPELFEAITVIITDIALAPHDDLLAGFHRAFERGLAHKLLANLSYDSVARIVDENRFRSTNRSVATVGSKIDETSIEPHPELEWQSGPGPTYDHEQALQMLRNRYEFLPGALSRTLGEVPTRADLRAVIATLRRKGWLDWHVMTALLNLRVNLRPPGQPLTWGDVQGKSGLLKSFRAPETDASPPIPSRQITVDSLNWARQMALPSLLIHWRLELRQDVPDLSAIETVLDHRYGYWTEDLAHEDPFPSVPTPR